MYELKEYILCSAVNLKGLIVTGRRHSDCIVVIRSLRPDLAADIKSEDLGFLTSLNRYVDRKEAQIIARDNNQFIIPSLSNDNEILTSEDLFGVDYSNDQVEIKL